MAISGMCFNLSMQGQSCSFRKLIFSKTKRLLIPFIITTLFFSVPIKYISGYFSESKNFFYDAFCGQFLLMGNSHLWYVMCLFEITIIYSFLQKLKLKKNFIYWSFLLVISWIGRLGQGHYPLLGICLTMQYLFFFALGAHSFNRLNKYKMKNIYIPILGFILIFILNNVLQTFECKRYCFLFFKSCVAYTLFAIIGGASMVFIAKHVMSYIVNWRIYNYCKKYSYELYLYSDPFNYLIIFIAYKIVGLQIYSDSVYSIFLFLIRALGTTIGAIFVIYGLKRYKILKQ